MLIIKMCMLYRNMSFAAHKISIQRTWKQNSTSRALLRTLLPSTALVLFTVVTEDKHNHCIRIGIPELYFKVDISEETVISTRQYTTQNSTLYLQAWQSLKFNWRPSAASLPYSEPGKPSQSHPLLLNCMCTFYSILCFETLVPQEAKLFCRSDWSFKCRAIPILSCTVRPGQNSQWKTPHILDISDT
jgi:hypothetical protein